MHALHRSLYTAVCSFKLPSHSLTLVDSLIGFLFLRGFGILFIKIPIPRGDGCVSVLTFILTCENLSSSVITLVKGVGHWES